MPVERRLQAEISVYPLRQTELAPPIEAAVDALRDAGLEPVPGTMSTAALGERGVLFDALSRAFAAASASGDVVMTIHVSNACEG